MSVRSKTGNLTAVLICQGFAIDVVGLAQVQFFSPNPSGPRKSYILRVRFINWIFLCSAALSQEVESVGIEFEVTFTRAQMLFICIMLPVPWGLEKALRVTIPDRKHSRRLIRARLTGAEFKLSASTPTETLFMLFIAKSNSKSNLGFRDYTPPRFS